jgi:hypothetical protein
MACGFGCGDDLQGLLPLGMMPREELSVVMNIGQVRPR